MGKVGLVVRPGAKVWTTVRIAAKLAREAKLEAVRRGVELGEFLSHVVRVGLDGVGKKGVRR